MTGHSDLLLGHVATRDPELHTKIDQWRTLTGSRPRPHGGLARPRSIATLPLRLERASENAQRIAEFLTTRKEVETVLYPGLPNHPGHAIAAKQMQLLRSRPQLRSARQIRRRNLLQQNQNSSPKPPASAASQLQQNAAHAGAETPVADGFIRMSAGCEAIEDLIEDIAQALDASKRHKSDRLSLLDQPSKSRSSPGPEAKTSLTTR